MGAEETLAQQRPRGDLGPASLRQQPLATPLYPSSSMAQSNAIRALSSATPLSARTGTWQMLQGQGQWHYLKPGPRMKSLPWGLLDRETPSWPGLCVRAGDPRWQRDALCAGSEGHSLLNLPQHLLSPQLTGGVCVLCSVYGAGEAEPPQKQLARTDGRLK